MPATHLVLLPALAALLSACHAPPVEAPGTPPTPASPQAQAPASVPDPGPALQPADDAAAPSPWDEALADLEAAQGFFTTHHDEDTLLVELDEQALGRPFLFVSALDSGAGNGDLYRGRMVFDTPYVMRFERRGEDRIVLLAENSNYLDGNDARESKLLDEVLAEGVIASFDVIARHEEDEKLLIDLVPWLASDPLGLAEGVSGGQYTARKELGAVADVAAFPRNVEIRMELVLGGRASNEGNLAMADPRGLMLDVRHSFAALPPDGYQPRAFDQRVGYIYVDRKALLDRASKDPVRRFIARWRLQKADPTADVSRPVQPIVFWVENTTPPEYREAVAQGIAMWEPAFRNAGFVDAIIAKQMPPDADWDPADVRYSVVRWSEDEDVGFAIGPSRTDPRTGEIYDADITLQASFLDHYGEVHEDLVASSGRWDKAEVLAALERRPGAADDIEAARGGRRRELACALTGSELRRQVAQALTLLPLVAPETDKQEFLRALIREVTAHEVGHALGLRHNFKASTWRTLEQLRDRELTEADGISNSVMDYPPIVIAPPGVEQGQFFQTVVGPYDRWAVEYGYREFASGEPLRLQAIAARSNAPELAFGPDEDMFNGDALCQTWDMGRDPLAVVRQQIEVTRWGLAHMLERGAEPGEGYHRYARYHTLLVNMYVNAFRGLGRFVGGYTLHRDVVGQPGGRGPIEVVDPDTQRQALDLMIEAGLRWSGGIPDEQHLFLAERKFGSFGRWFDLQEMMPVADLVNRVRFVTLAELMSVALYERLAGQGRLAKGDGLTLHEVGTRIFEAVWLPELPDEFDLWIQADFVDLNIRALDRRTTPLVRALFDDLQRRSRQRLGEYAEANDPTLASHGRWLADRIDRYRARLVIGS